MLLVLVDVACLAQLSLLRSRLVAQAVAKIGLLPLHLTGCGKLEALFSATVGLHFHLSHLSRGVYWHCFGKQGPFPKDSSRQNSAAFRPVASQSPVDTTGALVSLGPTLATVSFGALAG